MEPNEGLKEKQEDTQQGRYLTFSLGDEVFGLQIRYVTEIIGLQPVTKVPEVPSFIKGIINLRGKIHSCDRYAAQVSVRTRTLYRQDMHYRDRHPGNRRGIDRG